MIGVRGRDIVVLEVEKIVSDQAKSERTLQMVCTLNANVCMAFEGHNADVRIINRTWIE